jgi:hypothetical protein
MIRGCGIRQAGGIYLEVATSPFGMPLEHFLIDPPRLITPAAIGLTPIGVRGITDQHGVYHVVDWVGSEHYPKVGDFIDEAQQGGISRRCEGPGVDYSKITPESRLLLAHSRASFANSLAFMGMIAAESNAWRCTKEHCRCGICVEIATAHKTAFAACRAEVEKVGGAVERAEIDAEHAHHTDCLSLHWHDFTRAELVAGSGATVIGCTCDPRDRDRLHLRRRPHGDYYAQQRPCLADGTEFRPEYRTAIFARLPIGGIAVVRDREQTWRQTAQFDKASAAHVAVTLVDE